MKTHIHHNQKLIPIKRSNAPQKKQCPAKEGNVSKGGTQAKEKLRTKHAPLCTVAWPVGIAAAVVALVAVGLAVWMTDDDLQVFLKATVFSEDNQLPADIRTARQARQAKEYLYENRDKMGREYKQKLHNEERQTINMDNFTNMTEWLYGDSSFEYFMLIFPFDQTDPEQFYSIEDVWDRSFNEQEDAGFRCPIIKNPAGFYEIELHFHWKEELQELAWQNRLGKQMRFVFGCRVVINEDKKEYWPLVPDEKPRYAAYYGPLMFDSKTVQCNDFFRNLTTEYEIQESR